MSKEKKIYSSRDKEFNGSVWCHITWDRHIPKPDFLNMWKDVRVKLGRDALLHRDAKTGAQTLYIQKATMSEFDVIVARYAPLAEARRKSEYTSLAKEIHEA